MRVLTLNVWNSEGDVGARMRVALAQVAALAPDVIALQEVVSVAGLGHQAELFARAIGGSWVFDEVKAGAFGNAIASRFPIRAHDSVALPSADDDPRRALYAEIETPAGSLPFFTTHLSWQGFHAARREAQVVALDDFVRAHPASSPAIICGDFNTAPDSAAIWFMTGRMALAGRGAHYRDAFAWRHPHVDGFTWAERNPHPPRESELDRRVDYIFVGPGAQVSDARVVMDEPVDGVWASDHFGVVAEISR